MKVICLALILFIGSQAALVRKAASGEDDSCEDEGIEKCKHSPLEISFVVDASSSVMEVNFRRCMSFIMDFVSQFEIGHDAVRVSLVTFGLTEHADSAISFDKYDNKEELVVALGAFPYARERYTNTSAGIRYMLEHHIPDARPNVRRVVIVITDGQSQETLKTKAAAEAAHAQGLEVFAIGVGSSAAASELHTIASDARHVFTVSNYDSLENIKDRLAYESCDVPTYPECEMDPVDIAFVIDSSVSIGLDNFTEGMDFVRRFVDEFQVDEDHVHVAAVTFDDSVNVEDSFDFVKTFDKKEVLDRLAGIPWRHGPATNTGAGIAYMREELMQSARPDTAHVCIVLTDGNSQETEITRQEAELAHHQHIEMFAVGVGAAVNDVELENIAGKPENVIRAESYAELNAIKTQLISVTCDGILRNVGLAGMGAKSRYNPQ